MARFNWCHFLLSEQIEKLMSPNLVSNVIQSFTSETCSQLLAYKNSYKNININSEVKDLVSTMLSGSHPSRRKTYLPPRISPQSPQMVQYNPSLTSPRKKAQLHESISSHLPVYLHSWFSPSFLPTSSTTDLMSLLHKNYRDIDKMVSNRRSSLTEIIYEDEANHTKFRRNLLNKRNSPMYFSSLLESYLRIESPRPSSVRLENLQDFLNMAVLEMQKAVITGDQRNKLLEVFDELVRLGYGLKTSELDAYISLLKNNDNHRVDVDKLMEVIEIMSSMGLKSTEYTNKLFESANSEEDLLKIVQYGSEKYLELHPKMLTHIFRIYKEAHNFKGVINTFQLCLKTRILFYDSDLMNSMIESLIEIGFYSAARKIIMTTLELMDVEEPHLSKNNEYGLRYILSQGVAPKTMMLYSLRPKPDSFNPLFRYLVECMPSFSAIKEIKSLIDVMITNNIELNEQSIKSALVAATCDPHLKIWSLDDVLQLLSDIKYLNNDTIAREIIVLAAQTIKRFDERDQIRINQDKRSQLYTNLLTLLNFPKLDRAKIVSKLEDCILLLSG